MEARSLLEMQVQCGGRLAVNTARGVSVAVEEKFHRIDRLIQSGQEQSYAMFEEVPDPLEDRANSEIEFAIVDGRPRAFGD